MSSGDRPPADVLIDSAAHSGVFNMALDEALLELALERQHSVVRIYRWSEPTVSLGCFQSRQSPVPVAFQNLPIVRRLSGGGAILHDQELTYSVILPLEHPARHNPSGLYAVVHRALIQLLGDCGALAALRADHDARRVEKQASAVAADAVSQSEPFLCFLRGDPNDVVHSSGVKLIGSAQRRRRGVILQHGSILLRASSMAAELPGVQDLVPDFLLAQFAERLPAAVADAVADRWQRRDVLPLELQRADDILQRAGSV